MAPRFSLIAAALVAGLALAAPTALAGSEPMKRGLGDFGRSSGQISGPADTSNLADAADRARAGQISLYPDAVERAVAARQRELQTTSVFADAHERAVAGRADTNGLPVGHRDRYELDVPAGPVTAASTGSSGEIEWPQLGIGFAVGIVFVLGLMLAVRLTRSRPLAHG